MADSVAKRYANALFNIANEENKLLEYQQAYKLLMELFHEDERILSVLSSEFLSIKDKEIIIDELVKPFNLINFSNFLKLIMSKHRMNQFYRIQYEFNLLVNEINHIEEGIIYSTKLLSKDNIQKVENSISESIGVKVELHNKIDPSLIGGVKVVIHDHVYDGSLKNKLSKLKNELLGG